VSVTHGKVLEEIGYHCRDYFVAQPERFAKYPGGVVAHSTHVKGMARRPKTGVEKPRITVTLATGIDEARCAGSTWATATRDDRRRRVAGPRGEGILVVPRAGEMLYRVKR